MPANEVLVLINWFTDNRFYLFLNTLINDSVRLNCKFTATTECRAQKTFTETKKK